MALQAAAACPVPLLHVHVPVLSRNSHAEGARLHCLVQQVGIEMGTVHKAEITSTWWPRLMSLVASRALARGLEYFFTESTVDGVSSMACCRPHTGFQGSRIHTWAC